MHIAARQERLIKRTFVDYQATSEFLENPVIFEKAEGLYLWDVNGKKYFDAIGGIFVAVLGHRHPRVMDAMRRQMDRMTFAPPLHGISDVTLDFVESVGSVAPEGMEYVKGFSGGSEAVESALKFTRQYHKQTGNPGKYKFVIAMHNSVIMAARSGGHERKRNGRPQIEIRAANGRISARSCLPANIETGLHPGKRRTGSQPGASKTSSFMKIPPP